MNWTVDWVQVVSVAAGLYAAVIAVFLVLENRSPQSTFAWLFLMLGFPIGGFVIYTLFGRGWQAFSRKDRLHTLIEGTSLVGRKTATTDRQPALPTACVPVGRTRRQRFAKACRGNPQVVHRVVGPGPRPCLSAIALSHSERQSRRRHEGGGACREQRVGDDRPSRGRGTAGVSRRLDLRPRTGRSRSPSAAVQGRVLPRKDRGRGLEDLLHRVGEHEHPELLGSTTRRILSYTMRPLRGRWKRTSNGTWTTARISRCRFTTHNRAALAWSTP